MAANLSLSELYKYQWRIEQFLSKFKDSQEFELIDKLDGKRVGIIYSPLIEEWIRTKQRLKLVGAVLRGDDGKYYKFSDLKKTAEFRGRGANSGIVTELAEIESINNQLQEIKTQTLQYTVPLVIASNTYEISVCSKVSGNPKADFSLSNGNGEPIYWASHKKGNNPDHFQQFSGITQPPIKDHFESRSFVHTIHSMFPDGLTPKTCVGRKIIDNDLKMQSIYGNEYNKSPCGENNVNCIIQGHAEIEKSDNYYHLTAPIMHFNGEKLNDGYDPTFIARFDSQRNQCGISHSRIMIIPEKGRKINQYV